jgi:hypothetical protein
MDQKLKSEWVEALRGDKYRQASHRLRTKDDRYCCLGVLADLMGCKWSEHETKDCYTAIFPDGNESINTVPVYTCDNFGLDWWLVKDLIQMNDSGKFFDEIADVIEEKA